MAKKKFDTSMPHNHTCPECHKEVYCANLKCELKKKAECKECRQGYTLTVREGQPGYYRPRPAKFDGDDEVRRTKDPYD